MDKKKKITFLVTILLTLAMVFAIIQPVVFASTQGQVTNIAPQGVDTINLREYSGQPNPNTQSSKAIIGVSRNLIQILQLVGIGIALVMLVIIGIRFILNADKDKPDIKSVVISYVFGACCIFGATAILSFIQSLVRNFSGISA